MSKRYISDCHFGHQNIIEFDNRPFSSAQEMNDEMIARWNAVVHKNDDVYILGDMFWHNDGAIDILKTLKGNKYLVLGNHDKISSGMASCFIWIKDYAVVRDDSSYVVLSHYPICHWDRQYRGSIHLYGHIHNTQDYQVYRDFITAASSVENSPYNLNTKEWRAYNVGCMLPYMDYAPRTLEEIMEGVNNWG